ncbi:hypothetical protein C8R46DRAFT_1236152 [Mycena filopes]|nr:hypothetical protein C8R46DRAFT_1236152 [Mycena filopes]
MSFLKLLPAPRCVRGLGARSIHSKTLRLSTLNPLLLQPSDHIDLSGCRRRAIAFTSAPPKGATSPSLIYQEPDGGRLPFPPQSAGFLYFHRDPDAAPLEAALRFRLTKNASPLPSSFETGQDLLLPTGVPWQLILPKLLQRPFPMIVEQLLAEELITTTQISRCRSIFGSRRNMTPAFLLFRLGQEFPVDFSVDPTITSVAEELRSVQMPVFRATTWPVKTTIRPFTRAGLARFEPSVVDGHRLLHIRITKIVSPVVRRDPRGQVIEPKEGELLMIAPYGAAPRPWQYDVDQDTQVAAVLRALWPTA